MRRTSQYIAPYPFSLHSIWGDKKGAFSADRRSKNHSWSHKSNVSICMCCQPNDNKHDATVWPYMWWGGHPSASQAHAFHSGEPLVPRLASGLLQARWSDTSQVLEYCRIWQSGDLLCSLLNDPLRPGTCSTCTQIQLKNEIYAIISGGTQRTTTSLTVNQENARMDVPTTALNTQVIIIIQVCVTILSLVSKRRTEINVLLFSFHQS